MDRLLIWSSICNVVLLLNDFENIKESTTVNTGRNDTIYQIAELRSGKYMDDGI